MNTKSKSITLFFIGAVLALLAFNFLIVHIADATLFDLTFGFFLLLGSFISLSFGISNLIK